MNTILSESNESKTLMIQYEYSSNTKYICNISFEVDSVSYDFPSVVIDTTAPLNITNTHYLCTSISDDSVQQIILTVPTTQLEFIPDETNPLETTLAPTTTPTTTTPTTPTVPPMTSYEYQTINNQDYNISSGTWGLSDTVQNCKTHCDTQPTCMGFTRDTSVGDNDNGRCWFHDHIHDYGGDDDDSRRLYIKGSPMSEIPPNPNQDCVGEYVSRGDCTAPCGGKTGLETFDWVVTSPATGSGTCEPTYMGQNSYTEFCSNQNECNDCISGWETPDDIPHKAYCKDNANTNWMTEMRKKYDDARNICLNKGGSIAFPQSQSENDYLYNNYAQPLYGIWLGLREGQIMNDGDDTWNYGRSNYRLKDSDYTNWKEGYPTTDDGNKTILRYSDGWQNTSGDNWYHFVCEKDTGSNPPTETTNAAPTTTTTTPPPTTATPPPTTTETSLSSSHPTCDVDACNDFMYRWSVNKNWAFDTINHHQCDGCPRQQYNGGGLSRYNEMKL